MHSPYPFERLPKLTRGQVHALARVHSLFSDVTLEAALSCAGSLLGTTLACTFSIPAPCSSGRASGSSAVWVELESALGAEHALWLELPIALCEHLVDRVLGGDSLLAEAPSGAVLDELSLGALAYLLARIAAELGARFRLRSIDRHAPRLDDDFVSCPATLQSGAARATLRLHVPARLLRDVHAERPARLQLDSLPLSVWADAGSACLDLATLRSLEPGDVLVLDHARLDATYRGRLLVRVEGSSSALQCTAMGDRLEVESIACTEGPRMTSGRRIADPRDDASPLARDAPIELSVEVARFQLTLGELERLLPGDVLATGRRIGELVTLRAAGRAIAEGELVDVEGEIGVRLTRLLTPAKDAK